MGVSISLIASGSASGNPASGSAESDENAEVFFQRVMGESKTQITWPSKLKIGAKSKKGMILNKKMRQKLVSLSKHTLDVVDEGHSWSTAGG
uniref:Bicaudal C-like protein 1-B n=1 Tax=Magallana gigas TaxID=29159 RepID=K1Q5C0_MAGGI